MNNYIVLTTDDGSFSKKFKVLYEGASWLRGRAQNRQRTVTGKLDIQEGAQGKMWLFALRLEYDAVSSDGYGNLRDLQYLASLNDPSASPGNVIRMTDHLGDVYDVVFSSGQIEARPITPNIQDGPWIAQVQFEDVG